MEAILSKSTTDGKKYKVVVSDGTRRRTINFGAKGYEDYTIHHDLDRRNNYISRHSKRENWEDPFTAGFWSRWLLWEKPSLKQAIKFIRSEKKINLIVDEGVISGN